MSEARSEATGSEVARSDVAKPEMAKSEMGRADSAAVEAASTRLQRALAALEEAVERRRELERGRGALADQVHTIGLDRARLADALDREAARAERLDTVNREVADRLDQAIATVRTVLAGAAETPGGAG
ncbi:hypothetical protein RHODGE_RHODGE_04615 [Rhodoplanes serenus]|uniref:DUF4164 domain-containing protein n=1 Tax=Rhodoplanes serenus TaxID=200615 RepID=A0A3S5CYR2_9BRAD|nr:hypothetical protein RHODGE_RHODGE_04615 [Rhodoplanes serenus]